MGATLTYLALAASVVLAVVAMVFRVRLEAARTDRARLAESLDSLEQERQLLQHEQIELLELLRELPRLTAGPDADRRLRDIPEIIHRCLMRVFQPGQAMVFLRRRATSDQPDRGSQLILTAAQPDAFYQPGTLIEIGEGAVGRLAQCSGPVGRDELEPVEGDPSIDLGAPMMHGDEVVGVITLSDLARQRPFDRDLLWLLSSLGGYAIDGHARLSRAREVSDLDPLTRIYNKGALSLRLAEAVLKAESAGDVLSVLLFDVDHFKGYNELNGHLAGDELLRQLASFVNERIRSEDIFGRFGGEEFLIVFPGRSAADALVAGENIRSAIASRDFLFGERQPAGRMTISGGVAEVPSDAASSGGLLKAADEALRAAKNGGRNQVTRFVDSAFDEVASAGG